MIRSISCFFFLSCLMILTPLYAGNQTLTTYYPAPQGNYKNMTVNDVLTFEPYPSPPAYTCNAAGNVVNLVDIGGKLNLCDSTGMVAVTAMGLWTGTGTYMYPTSYNTENVGIGMNTLPAYNFEVTGTAGITGATAMLSTASVAGLASLNGGVAVTGNATVSGTATVTGLSSLNGGVNVTGPANVSGLSSLNGGVAVTGNASVSGTTTLNGPLQVNNSATITGNLQVNGAINATTITTTGNIFSNTCVGVPGGSCLSPSDMRLKKNIVPLVGTLSNLDQIRGVSFQWNHLAATIGQKEDEQAIGIIAQELQKVYPQLVKSAKSENGGYLFVDYGKFTAVLLQSVKELKSRMNGMQEQIDALQEKVKMLEKQK